jgi:hypothetical protein
MYVEIIVLLTTTLISVSLVGKAWENGALNRALSRAFAGGSVGVVSNKFLTQYTQFESLITASINGNLGFTGFFFVGALILLLTVWITNFIKYRSLVV